MVARHVLLSAALLLAPAGAAFAQTPATQSPTAKCRDGALSYSTTRAGSCSRHGGVAEWLVPTGATAQCNDSTYSTSTSRQGACSRHGGVALWLSETTNASATATQVWVNTGSGVYHCPGTRYYGGTKQGVYMTEVEARSKGYRAAYGRSCT